MIIMASRRTGATDVLLKLETCIFIIMLVLCDSVFPAAWATTQLFAGRVCSVRKRGWWPSRLAWQMNAFGKAAGKLSLVSAVKNERHVYVSHDTCRHTQFWIDLCSYFSVTNSLQYRKCYFVAFYIVFYKIPRRYFTLKVNVVYL